MKKESSSEKSKGATSREFWTGKRTHKTYPTIEMIKGFNQSDQRGAINFVAARALQTSQNPKDIVKPMSQQRKIAEFLFILRPLIYGSFHFHYF